MTAPSADPLYRSLRATVLMDGGGDVQYARECRGGVSEWGGVFGQLVRLTGRWSVAVIVDGQYRRLSEVLLEGGRDGERWRGRHRIGPLSVDQEIGPLPGAPAALRRLRISVERDAPVTASVVSEFVPFLLPVLVEGIRPVDFRLTTADGRLRVRQRGFGLDLHWNIAPSYLFVNRGSWRGGRRDGPAETIASEHVVSVAPDAPVDLRWVVSGGLERDLDGHLSTAQAVVAGAADPFSAGAAADDAWRATTPRMQLPDAPEWAEAYTIARDALRRLYVDPGDGLVGVVAGFPWYAAIWCRDLAWMLPALLWLGDFEWVERSLASVFRFQCPDRLPLLGGSAGELPMQVAPGPVFLYGTSDTSLYFPGLVERARRHSGDAAGARAHRPVIERVIAWGRARQGPNGWVTNGGEALSIAAATRGLAHVRLGIDAPDTTIWDSADRRDHAIDVQVLWIEALRAATALAGGRRASPEAEGWAAEADRLATRLVSDFAWPGEDYLVDSLRSGRAVARLRPNALRAVSAGLVPSELSGAVVDRALRGDLTTPWGVRTLSTTDPAYRPQAYHEGQVWPVATAWAIDAAFAAGRNEAAWTLLGGMAARLREEGGGANECYRGDRPEPFNSCFLLGMSVAPFLTVLFERLWGLSVEAGEPRLGLRPAFPPGWSTASLDGLRIGDGRASVEFAAPSLTVRWSGPGTLTVAFPTEVRPVPPGGAVSSVAGPRQA